MGGSAASKEEKEKICLQPDPSFRETFYSDAPYERENASPSRVSSASAMATLHPGTSSQIGARYLVSPSQQNTVSMANRIYGLNDLSYAGLQKNQPIMHLSDSRQNLRSTATSPAGTSHQSSPTKASKKRYTAGAKMPPLTLVYDQIDHFLNLLQEMGLDTFEDNILNYHKMMAFYNDRLLPFAPQVSFGNMMTVLRKHGLILPKTNPSVVTIVGARVSLLHPVATTLQGDLALDPEKPYGYVQSGTINDVIPEAMKKKTRVRKKKKQASVSAHDSEQSNSNDRSVEDLSSPILVKPEKGSPVKQGTTFPSGFNLKEQETLDEKQFSKLYKNLLKQGQGAGETPTKLSGAPHKMLIQGKVTKERRSNLKLNFLQSEDRLEIALEIIVAYCANDITISNVSSFIIGSSKLTFGTRGILNFSAKKTHSKVILYLDASNILCEEFIVVFKFKKIQEDDDTATPIREFFLMKKMLLRVDDDSTREDGEVVDSKPSVQSEELVEKNSADFMAMEIEDDDSKDLILKPKMKVVRKLKEYPIPEEYLNLFNSKLQTKDTTWSKTLISQSNILEDLNTGLTNANYSRLFALLLFLEEHQTVADLKEYTMRDVFLRQDRGLFALEVPGLAENRPSVLKYDTIFITLPNGKSYVGTVKFIQNTQVQICLGKKFLKDYVDKMRVTVRFSFNRNCLKVQHRALELMNSTKMIDAICFPKEHSQFVDNLPVMSWFNRLVGSNPEQCQAVQNIVDGTSKPAPYLVFGPPGTGKTVTIVESIKQIWRLHENSHILATAPSNSAADLLAERIIESLPVSQVLRFYSPSRDNSQVPETLRRCCNFEGSESYIPDLKELQKYRVIICTLICAGRLYTGGFQSGFFSHIFVDECGHAMEPTALVPFAGLLGPPHKPTQIVLSGDPKQLGPVVRSPVAQQVGLGNSFLGRLMDTVDLYKRDSYGSFNPKVLTKLVANFRSHPDILKVPNELFYDNDLMPNGEKLLTYSAVNWEHLPTKGFPMIFHGVSGKEDQEAKSPSYFNISEVSEVVKYVEKILDSKFCGQKLRPGDIGIISPYRGQISKIHRALERKRIKGVGVGSVEEFQGQERRVIIISTVRSNPLQLQIDRKFRIGFVREPKRFNVAVTRAKSLLIVIGNPVLLETDKNWCYLLRHIYSNGGYTGCQYSHDMKKPLPAQADHGSQIESKMQSHFQKLLHLNQKVVGDLQEVERESAFATDTAIEDLMQQIRNLTFVSEGETSAVEKYVSPPITMFEQ